MCSVWCVVCVSLVCLVCMFFCCVYVLWLLCVCVVVCFACVVVLLCMSLCVAVLFAGLQEDLPAGLLEAHLVRSSMINSSTNMNSIIIIVNSCDYHVD